MTISLRSSAPAHRRRVDRPPQPAKFRPDIEGMRAIAVLSVVLYHADLFGVRGGYIGVDVFFVISGFLITSQLLETVGKRGVRAMPTFYTRRIRRLLPASATVVIATMLAVRRWGPPLSVHSSTIDGIFTTFYGLNYRLAIEGTQYLNQGVAPSPFQHYWSLAVEEQFYFCWPILIALIAFLGRRHRNVLLAAVLVVAGIISFHFSVVLTRTDEPWAYFSLVTRIWELALGALVAVAATQLARLPAHVAVLGRWLGLVAVVGSAFAYTNSTHYPGSAVALPVVGAALVIACGCGPGRGRDPVLGTRPMQYFGRMSYSWYLWHWPMLIVAPMFLGVTALSWSQRLIVVILSLLAATATYYVIENPARSLGLSNPRWFAGGALLSGSVLVVAALILANLPNTTGKGAPVSVEHATTDTAQVASQMRRAIAAGLLAKYAPRNLEPSLAQAHGETPISSTDECHADLLVVNQGPCVFGDPNGAYTAVLFGDSHMQQWQPGFDAAGAADGWRVVNWTKSACPPAQLTVVNQMLKRTYSECNTWRSITLQRIAALHPNLVVMSGADGEADPSVSPAAYAAATVETLRTLRQTTNARIVFLQDTPMPPASIPACVAVHLTDVESCDFSLGNAYPLAARHQATAQAVEQMGGVTVIDPRQWFCQAGECPAVVGNLLVYRDTAHISVEFSTWLAPLISDLLKASEHPQGG